ncbi:MAG: hypothetical protein M3378_06925 [Actinomycetota bacterium]|nr:hypothetical protein [Actinomycetota bacterium]
MAHLERTKPNSYAHQILVEHLAALVNNPRVQADLANRAGYDADGAVATPLHERSGSAAKTPATGRKRSGKRNIP